MLAMTNEKFYTVDQIAELLQLSRDTIMKWIDAGELPAYQVGRRWRIKSDDFNQFMEHRKSTRGKK